MPTINRPPIALTDQEILCVIAYLQSLGGTATVTLQTAHNYYKPPAAAPGAPGAPGGAPPAGAPPDQTAPGEPQPLAAPPAEKAPPPGTAVAPAVPTAPAAPATGGIAR